MTTKEYLRQIRTLNLKIQRRQRELDELRALATSSTPTVSDDRVLSSGSGDKMSSMVDRYIDLEREIDDLIDRLVDTKHRIIGEIHQLEDPRYIQLLELRYVDCEIWDQIALDMHMDVRWVYRLHGFALQAFSDILASESQY